MKKQLKKGFTLTELVIVIVIIAILAAVLIPSMTGYVNRAKKSNATQEAASAYTIYSAWLADITKNGGYESVSSQLVKENDIETLAEYYSTSDTIYLASAQTNIATEVEFKTASETGFTVAHSVTSGDTWVLSQVKTAATKYTEKTAGEHNSSILTTSFETYYKTAQASNSLKDKFNVISSTKFYMLSSNNYLVTVTLEDGAPSYEVSASTSNESALSALYK